MEASSLVGTFFSQPARLADVARLDEPHPRKRDPVLGGQALDDSLEDLVGGGCFANS
jgi:hypothetical protein